jgi:hypothetical protein
MCKSECLVFKLHLIIGENLAKSGRFIDISLNLGALRDKRLMWPYVYTNQRVVLLFESRDSNAAACCNGRDMTPVVKIDNPPGVLHSLRDGQTSFGPRPRRAHGRSFQQIPRSFRASPGADCSRCRANDDPVAGAGALCTGGTDQTVRISAAQGFRG